MEEKKYYIDALHRNAGVVKINEEKEPISDYFPVHRSVTLSALRHQAEKHYRDKARQPTVEVASDQSLTEAERVFQRSING